MGQVAAGLGMGALAAGGIYGAYRLVAAGEDWREARDARHGEPSIPDWSGTGVMMGTVVGGIALAVAPTSWALARAMTTTNPMAGLATYLGAGITGAALVAYEAAN